MVESPRTLGGVELALRLGCTSVSCVLADAMCLPMDTVKVRLQLERSQRGVVGTSLRMARSEGLASFWSGLTPAAARQATYGGLSFCAYPMVRDRLEDSTNLGKTASQVLAGSLSGGGAAALANPTDVVKVRMQADGRRAFLEGGKPTSRYASVFATVKAVYREGGGLRAFYAGLAPNVGRASVVNGAGMAAYDSSKSLVSTVVPPDFPLLQRFAAALVGGVASTLAGCPFDVVKTRLMATFPSSGGGVVHCVVHTAREEGLLAFWKGALPVYSRQGPFNMLNYLIMEALLDRVMPSHHHHHPN
mmetsp:Transcript_28024/g.90343  ORF Transcript_28024/g.90343 Transcript_28024/m.90343 type:complete len:304 (+) Transcript_28024:137-1048(+)|eukprot:CAMPEP_0118904790 /NCGR_PEP_ID=MMETSP1166-20130328/9108_1 /TAXON_ID=1104430 /ORGANISM="Chrysoreinhardia sp, Strain CCMP3193" /LENGTH=303 /DNA_ID=CAMNT_0006844057 /DNA_START=76 /DNA_END=987 /DNA_ORIENTATION=-